jgi:hypothetical protein
VHKAVVVLGLVLSGPVLASEATERFPHDFPRCAEIRLKEGTSRNYLICEEAHGAMQAAEEYWTNLRPPQEEPKGFLARLRGYLGI